MLTVTYWSQRINVRKYGIVPVEILELARTKALVWFASVRIARRASSCHLEGKA